MASEKSNKLQPGKEIAEIIPTKWNKDGKENARFLFLILLIIIFSYFFIELDDFKLKIQYFILLIAIIIGIIIILIFSTSAPLRLFENKIIPYEPKLKTIILGRRKVIYFNEIFEIKKLPSGSKWIRFHITLKNKKNILQCVDKLKEFNLIPGKQAEKTILFN